MTDSLQLLKTRRSAPVPMLADPGPDAGEIDTLLTIATRVPDHGKLAPWRFILFSGDARTRAGAIIADAFADANPGADAARVAIERNRFSAPLVIGVVSRPVAHKVPEWEQVLSAGAVCMNLTIAAAALGYASSWLTEWYAYDPSVRAQFGLAPHEKVAGFVQVGTPTGPRADRPRPVLADLVSDFQGRHAVL